MIDANTEEYSSLTSEIILRGGDILKLTQAVSEDDSVFHGKFKLDKIYYIVYGKEQIDTNWFEYSDACSRILQSIQK